VGPRGGLGSERLKKAADVNFKDYLVRRSLHLAAQNIHVEVMKLLTLVIGTSVHGVAYSKRLDAVEDLLEGEANINASSQDNVVPSYYITDNSV
jgi:ankyrin repeat protein